MSRILTIGGIALPFLLTQGCAENPVSGPEAVISVSHLTKSSGPDQGAEKKKLSYRGVLVETADHQRYTDGKAVLAIHYRSNDSAHLKLHVDAQSESGEAWNGTFDLPEQAVSETPISVKLGQDPGQMRGSIRHIARDGKISTIVETGTVTLRRKTRAGQHSAFVGTLATDSSASTVQFEAEYHIACHVPPEMIGRPPKSLVSSYPGSTGILLVLDAELKSEFCRKFATLQ